VLIALATLVAPAARREKVTKPSHHRSRLRAVSELSESGHLRTENPEHAVALLKRAKVPGYVFPARNGWVSFVYPTGDETRFDLAQANEKTLLLYEYAADHGCWVTVYEGKKPITRLKAPFDRPGAAFDRNAFESRELVSPAGGAAIEAWIKRAHLLHERLRAPHLVAERLHLPRYAWFSFLGEQTKDQPEPQRIEVSAKGTVKRPPKPVAPHVAVAVPKPAKKAPKKTTTAKKKARVRR
jgi:hypothetical protein